MVDFKKMGEEAKRKLNEMTDDDKDRKNDTQHSDPKRMIREDRSNSENRMPEV